MPSFPSRLFPLEGQGVGLSGRAFPLGPSPHTTKVNQEIKVVIPAVNPALGGGCHLPSMGRAEHSGSSQVSPQSPRLPSLTFSPRSGQWGTQKGTGGLQSGGFPSAPSESGHPLARPSIGQPLPPTPLDCSPTAPVLAVSIPARRWRST